MTTEQKARAYDEAIKVIKDNLDALNEITETGTNIVNIQSIKNCFYRAFPELKENEDERIGKAIHNALKYLEMELSWDFLDDVDILDAYAWLEKQCNKTVDCPQNHQDVKHPNGGIVMADFNGGEGFYKLHLDYLNKKQVEEVEEMVRMWNKESKTSDENIKDCIGMCLTDANEQRFKDYGTNLKDCLNWLEKQGEQKPILDFNAKDWYVSKVDGKIHNIYHSVDKIEPKFKVGDWVVKKDEEPFANGNHYARITNIDKEQYWFDSDSWLEAEDIRLWTIQDAKDGDMLASKGKGGQEVGIIKEFIGKYGGYNKCFETYCYSDLDGTFRIGEYMGGISIRPATKEQRGLLFQKMKEAGYEWDSDKKELKKIENEIEIPFGAKDSELQEVTYYIPKGFHAEIDDDKVVIKKSV